MAQLNNLDIMVVKVQGEFVWHKHNDTDDFFLVLSGRLQIRLRDRTAVLDQGELFVVPRGVDSSTRLEASWQPSKRDKRADLRDQQKLERARLQQEQARFPAFKEWLAQKNPELAQQCRYRERRPATIEGPALEQPAPHDIRAFEARPTNLLLITHQPNRQASLPRSQLLPRS